jgi:hypothetical protein
MDYKPDEQGLWRIDDEYRGAVSFFRAVRLTTRVRVLLPKAESTSPVRSSGWTTLDRLDHMHVRASKQIMRSAKRAARAIEPCRVAIMIATKSSALTTATVAPVTGRKARGRAISSTLPNVLSKNKYTSYICI